MKWTAANLIAFEARQAVSRRENVPTDAAEREGDLQDQIIAECRRRGWVVIWSRMDRATTTPVGTPDLIIMGDGGRSWIVEAKSRSGKLRPAQLGVKLMLEKLGHQVHVVRSLTEFLAILAGVNPPEHQTGTGFAGVGQLGGVEGVSEHPSTHQNGS